MTRRQDHRRTTARHLWLAALGLGVVARREVGRAACRASDAARTFGASVRQAGEDGADIALGAWLTAQERFAADATTSVHRRRPAVRRSGTSGVRSRATR